MLKYLLLAGAMTISVPALAQDKPVAGDPAAPAETTSQPTTQTATSPAPAESQTAPDAMTATDQAATGAPAAQDSTVAQQAPASAPADPATAAPGQAVAQQPAPATSKAEQVAQVVNTEFPSYDKDANGDLSEPEFASWMVALKTASDPATKAESAEVKKWIDQAFASADADKSKSVSKTELTGFLSQGG
ncbi:hypothetical protein G4G27_13135 [Sphingomonas sp. So64.6b]|uniref:hypothetical protein n=1 Tax=Sphingomonas sp. So64.6b TaxID=2997354 RepID=UPI0015FF4BA8|nr:hypothetical protein [Sphingomonas sp. So64.6b]QNA84832.1 hypothetical protein G4G27_13135 [Sphingomonas sp. So64.6b]